MSCRLPRTGGRRATRPGGRTSTTRVRLAALAAACLAGPAAAEPTTEPVPIAGDFQRVALRVPFRLEVTEGETAVTVTSERPVRERLRIQVHGDQLVVDSERELPWGARGLVAVRMKEFRVLRIDGSGDARELRSSPRPRYCAATMRPSGLDQARAITGVL